MTQMQKCDNCGNEFAYLKGDLDTLACSECGAKHRLEYYLEQEHGTGEVLSWVMGSYSSTMLSTALRYCDSIFDYEADDFFGAVDPDSLDENDFRERCEKDIASFLCCLAAEDGAVSENEATYINAVLHSSCTSDEILDIADKFKHEDDPLTGFPKSLELVSKIENATEERFEGNDFERTRRLLRTYAQLGSELIVTDMKKDESEVEALTNYMDFLDMELEERRGEWLYLGEYSNLEFDMPIKAYVNGERCELWNLGSQTEDLSHGEKLARNNAHTSESDSLNSKDAENDGSDDAMKQLMGLVGLESVKREITTLGNLVRVRNVREQQGLKQPDLSLHMVFTGNPGTGKTTVARLLAQVYANLGVLSKGHLIEVDRSGLVAGYTGQTALKTKQVVDQAVGGILFIDEAYALTVNRNEADFGYEAVDTLLKGMEDHRGDLVVIVAGYTEPMQSFLSSNPGLRSRFNKFLDFPDYSPGELSDIFMGMCESSDMVLAGEEERRFLNDYFQKLSETCDQSFANARSVRNFFERALSCQANRLIENGTLELDSLREFKLDDLVLASEE